MEVQPKAVEKSTASLFSLAAMPDPLQELRQLVSRLRSASAESRNLEWKRGGLFGPSVTTRTKYRAVKAAISFANADGGFVVFGVDTNGTWEGISDEQLAEFDPAKVTELINGAVFPEIPTINYAEFSVSGKQFAVIHIPPSGLIPHVTTKAVLETDASGAKRTVLEKHAVYYRHGAKSAIATPLQHQRIVERRTDHLRDDLLRRVREVHVPVRAGGRPSASSTGGTGTVMTVARLTKDPNAAVVHVTRAPAQASGVLFHEELSDGLFDEINNVLDANTLLAGATRSFVFGEEIYYRIYAERQHVQTSGDHVELLLRTAFRGIYGPFLFWLTLARPELVAQEVLESIANPKHPLIIGTFRVVALLGAEPLVWLDEVLDRRYKRFAQPPEFYWTFKKIVNRTGVADRRVLAMRTSPTATLRIPGEGELKVSQLLANPGGAAAHLSRVCMRVFEGDRTHRTLARQLDIAAYGQQIEERATKIWSAIHSMAKG